MTRTLRAELVDEAAGDLGEGPSWDAGRQQLSWVDITRGVVHLADEQGRRLDDLEVGEDVGAALPTEDGWLLATRRGFVLLSTAGARRDVLPFLAERADQRLNDAKCDPWGRAFAGSLHDRCTGQHGHQLRLRRSLGRRLVHHHRLPRAVGAAAGRRAACRWALRGASSDVGAARDPVGPVDAAATTGRHLVPVPSERFRMSTELLIQQVVLPVLRTATAEDAYATARALAAGGLLGVELTMTTPDVFDVAARLVAGGLTVGVGTITRTEEVERAAAAGASFVVSFARPPGFVAAALDASLTPVPGGITPHEVFSALSEGATWIKIFPGRLVGPQFLSDLAPLTPSARFVVTGGLDLSVGSLQPWLDTGAEVLGVGREVGTVGEHGTDEVTRRARAATELVCQLHRRGSGPQEVPA